MKKITLVSLSILMLLSPLVVSAASVELTPDSAEARIDFDFEGLTFDELMETISDELLEIFYQFGIEFDSLECFDQLAHLEDDIWDYMEMQEDALFFEFYYLVLAFTPEEDNEPVTLSPLERNTQGGPVNVSPGTPTSPNASSNPPQITSLRRTGVAIRNTNFRRGPGSGYGVIRPLSSNTDVRITGRQGDWYRVRHDSTTGWVLRNDMVRTNPVAIVTGNNVPVRNGRSNDARILTRAATGTRLRITQRNGSWARVTVNGHDGWIRTNQISVSRGSRPGIITSNNVNLHSRPTSSSSVTRRLPQDARVMILQRTTSGWSQIRITHSSGTINGWVRTSNVSNQNLSRRTTRQTALRARPDSDSARITTLSNNQSVTLLARAGSWGHVRAGNNSGWVRMSHLNDMTRPSQPLDIGSAARNPTWGVTANRTSLRSGAGSSHSELRTISSGTTLIIDRRSGEWLRTTYQGTTGWIHHDSIRVGTRESNSTTRRGRLNTSSDMRRGAGTNYGVVHRVSSGTRIRVLRQSGNWLQIRSGEIEGWVREYHVDTTGTGHVNIRSAMRSGPGSSYGTLRHISAGHSVTILYQNGNWLRIRFESQNGWIDARNVNLTTPPGLTTARSQVGSATRTVDVSGEPGLRLIVPRRRTLAAGAGFDHLEGVRIEHVAANGSVTRIPITWHQNSWSWRFTHNGRTFTVEMDGVMDNLTPGTYERRVVVRHNGTRVARAAHRVVVR